MDYKYIEQLLERYWACETSLQEEHILRTFFQQEDVPAHLMVYKAIFAMQQEQSEPVLGEDFDVRMLQLIEDDTVKALPLKAGAGRRSFLRPFYQAAGFVALVLTIGIAAQRSFEDGDQGRQTQYAQTDSMERPADEFVVLPEQQEAAVAAGQDSVNLTR